MAQSDIIREYLVSLGFKIDQDSLNKLDSALVKTTKAALAFAGTLTGMATATTAFVEHVADKMEDLYWSSVRLRDGVASIQNFTLGVAKAGGTVDGAMQSLEGMAAFLRTNPAGEGFLNNLGVKTRDAKNNLRGTIDIVKDFAHLPMPYWLKVNFAQRFGVDEASLQAIIRAAPEAESLLSRLYRNAGMDADHAAEKSVEFKNKLRDLGGTWDVLAVLLETRLLPLVNKLVGFAEAAVGVILKLDQVTGGLSTQLGLLVVAIYGVNTALRLTFGASLAQLLWRLMGNLALLTVGVFPALAEAVWAVGVAFSRGIVPGIWAATRAMVVFLATNPVGWAILLVSLGVLVWQNWEKVWGTLQKIGNWMATKYNAMAKVLGLPQIEIDKPWQPAERDNQADAAATDDAHQAGMPNWRERERNLGPNTQYGGPAANDNGGLSKNPELTGKALAFFQKAGWTLEQSAGIVANLVHESGLNPGAVGDRGKAVGVAQWHPDRQAKFKEWAGHDIKNSTLEEQLGFVNHELTRGAEQFAGKMLAGSRNAADAAARMSKYYERPKDTVGEMVKRGRTAANLVDGTRLSGGGGGNKTVVIHQKTDIKVAGSEPGSTARAVGREQGRVNGDMARNFAGAQS